MGADFVRCCRDLQSTVVCASNLPGVQGAQLTDTLESKSTFSFALLFGLKPGRKTPAIQIQDQRSVNRATTLRNGGTGRN